MARDDTDMIEKSYLPVHSICEHIYQMIHWLGIFRRD